MNRQLQLLIFLLDDRQYALRLGQVQRVIRAVDATPIPNAPAIVLGAIDIQGTIVPLLNIRQRFGIRLREVEPADLFIIASTARKTVALAVDDIKDIVDRPAEQVIASDRIFPSLEMVAGAIQLEDGLVLIHDLDRFLSADEERIMEEALEQSSRSA